MKTSEKILAVVVVIMIIVWGLLSLQKKGTKIARPPTREMVREIPMPSKGTPLPEESPEEVIFEIIPDEDALTRTWDLVCDPFVKLKTKKVDSQELSKLRVEGIIWSETPPRLAVINDVTVAEGDIISGFKVEEIQKGKVILNKEGNRYPLELWRNESNDKK